MSRVTVLTRQGCPACRTAEVEVARICAELDVGWITVDVDTDPELHAEYGEHVPVLLVDGVEHGFWVVDESRLRATLSR